MYIIHHFLHQLYRTKCYAVDTYDTSSSSSACPAFCKLRENIDRLFCSGKTAANLKVKSHTGNAVLIKSPKYDCNQTYPKNFMCIYSVKLSCSANRLVISHSDIDLSENDYVQVIDNSKTNVYSPVTGDSWPTDQHHYPSSNLKVILWSDHDNSQGKGFSLQFSCSAIDQVPTQQESGDSLLMASTCNCSMSI